MEKKYYDLIISLIKQHRKYPGLEAIIEDIANDVYEHSKVVIGSVTNEDVITAYINKVIATSIVTVPKKMNFNAKTRHRIITTLPQPLPVTEKPVVVEELSLDQTDEEEIVIQETSFTDQETSVEELSFEIEEENSTEEINFESENTDLETDEFSSEELVFESENQDEVITEDVAIEEIENNNIKDETEELLVEELEISDNNVVEPDEITNISHSEDVNKDFVDMMINGVPKTELKEDLTEINDSEEDNTTEIYESLDEICSEEESALEAPEETDVLQLTEDVPVEELEITENSLSTESEEIAQLDTEEITEIYSEEIEEATSLEEQDEDFNLIQEETDPVELIEQTESETIEEDSNLDLENTQPSFEIEEVAETMELEAFESENNDIIDITEESSFDLTLEDDTIEELESGEDSEIEPIITATQADDSSDFTPPTFDCFNYIPKKPEYDSEEIFAYLEDIDAKHPERQILTICNLKYKQKMSVTEIAQEVDFTEEEVIDVLNEIIDTIKD